MSNSKAVRHRDHGASRFACQCGYCSFDLDAAVNGGLKCLQREGGTSGFDRTHIQSVIRCRVRIKDDRGMSCLGRNLLEYLYPFASDFWLENGEAGDVPAGPN